MRDISLRKNTLDRLFHRVFHTTDLPDVRHFPTNPGHASYNTNSFLTQLRPHIFEWRPKSWKTDAKTLGHRKAGLPTVLRASPPSKKPLPARRRASTEKAGSRP